MYGLRKIHTDGIHYNFQWPLEVGAVVKCPDWNPEPECGGGLHFLPEALGSYGLLIGHYWCVVEFDETKMVKIDDEKAKVEECKIVYLSESPDGLKDYFKSSFDKFDSKMAYYWAIDIGNRDIMIDHINNSEWAYRWATVIGNQDIMIDRITESEWAYCWAKKIGNQDIMIDRITEPHWAYWWAKKIGNQDIMIEKFLKLKNKL